MGTGVAVGPGGGLVGAGSPGPGPAGGSVGCGVSQQ